MLLLEKELNEALGEEENYWHAKAKIFKANKVCTPEKATFTAGNRISREMNCQLTRPLTSEEVQNVVFEMSPNKSPGPDVSCNGVARGYLVPTRGLCRRSYLYATGCGGTKSLDWGLHNVLPTKTKLRQKEIIVDAQCPLCHDAPETLEHLFLHCTSVAPFWYGPPWHFRTNIFPWASIQQWWEHISAEIKEAGAKNILEQVVCCIQLALDYNEAIKILQSGRMEIGEGKYWMEVLNAGEYKRGKLKLNCDAAFLKESSRGADGNVMRNSNGDILGPHSVHCTLLHIR
ncbi:hypothetical protein LIER_20702 [Lithospermum erythrorhizon]|uniref:Reverse transcriptase zinc-binding domain-containing protein n=1 Tax=Lithospermum erythrorhizon TaxID=34254 RepID=A0AAV3QPV4_LITER